MYKKETDGKNKSAVGKGKMKTHGGKFGFKKAVVVTLSVILSFCILSGVASAVVFRIIFSRIEKSDTLSELPFSYVSGEITREKIEFYSDENRLCGYLYGQNPDSVGVVIVANGFSSDADSHLPEILYFTENNLTVLAFDNTGVGESEGDGRRGLSQPKLDLICAVDYVKSRENFKNMPVFLYGHSAGGYAVANTVSQREISAAVTVCAFNSPLSMMYSSAKERVGALATLQYPFLSLENKLLFGSDADTLSLESVNATTTPMLIFGAEEDQTVYGENSLYAHKDEIKNPNAECILITEDGRDTHSGAWLSADAVSYRNYVQKEYERVKNDEKKLSHLIDTVNYEKANRLDMDFIEKVTEFFLSNTAPKG